MSEASPNKLPPLPPSAEPPGLGWLRLKLRVLNGLSTELAFREAWRIFCTPRRLPLKAWEAEALASAHAFHVPFEGGQLAAYAWNAGPARRTVLLVHGWEHRASFWGALATALAQAGYHVVALDGPAHGRSSGRRTTLPEFGRAVQALATYLGPVWGVVGHSFGAVATASLPVRFNQDGLLPRLVLSAPGSTPAVFQRFANLLQLSAAVMARMERFVREQSGRNSESFSLMRGAPPINAARALLLHDTDDASVPFAEAEEIARNWPGLEFQPTSGLGHNRIMRDAAVQRRILSFLED